MSSFKNHLRAEQGITLAEMVLAMIISAAVMLGLYYSHSEIVSYLNKEQVAEDVNHYGNLVVDEIAKSLRSAIKVTLGSVNANRTLRTEVSSGDKFYIFVDPDEGMVRDYNPHQMAGSSDKPDLPRIVSFMDQNARIELRRFWVDPIPTTNFDGNVGQDITKMRQYIYRIELDIDLITYRRNRRIVTPFEFRRDIFARNYYLVSNQNSSGSALPLQ